MNSDESTGRWPTPELAAVLRVSTKTVERVRRQFCEEGLAMFEPEVRKTPSYKKIDDRVEAHLSALLCQDPPDKQVGWQLRLLAERLVELQVVEHISTTMIARLLKKTNSSLSRAPRSG